MKPVFCSFFTPEYRHEASELINSLDAFDLDFDVRAITSQGSWVRNCGMKPMFLRQMMAAHPGRPLVWLDADARVRQYPSLFDTLGCDLACHYKDGTELLSGTLYFGPDAGSLLEAWERECLAHPDEWDQRNLQRLIERENRWVVESLPASYVAIFDCEAMGTAETWVISHHQMSRKLKRVVNAG